MNSVHILIETLSRSFPVEWDRYTKTDDGYYVVYGWLPRTDGQRDFLLLSIWETDPPCNVFYATSSAKYSEEICCVLYGTIEGHTSCRKISELIPPH